jgi:hypothetical protein
MKFFEKLLETKFVNLFVLGGILFLASSFVEISYFKANWTAALISAPHWVLFTTGIGMLVVGALIYWLDHFSGSWITRRRVVSDDRGFIVKLGSEDRETQIRVIFGRLEKIDLPADHGAFVLPANEFFDGDCYEHDNTALGSFAQAHFTGNDFQDFVAEVEKCKMDSGLLTEAVEKEIGVMQQSYMPGSFLFLDRPVKKDLRLILTAVSTKRAGEGIRSEAAFLFSAVSRLHAFMADKRIESIVMPLLGAGKGGLKKGAALFMLVSAFADAASRPSGHHLKSITIVIFQQDGSKPEIKRSSVRRIIGVATAMFG